MVKLCRDNDEKVKRIVKDFDRYSGIEKKFLYFFSYKFLLFRIFKLRDKGIEYDKAKNVFNNAIS